MSRLELIELLLAQLKIDDPTVYKAVMSDLLSDLGYGDLIEAFDDALSKNCLPWTTLQ